MAPRFTSTDRASVNGGVKVLAYGDSGVGKTVLCSTAPAPIIISAEAGLLSLRRLSIPVIEVATIDELTDAYNWCAKAREAQPFQTVCIDSISEIGEVVLSNAKRQVKDPRQAYGELIEKMTMVIRAFRDLPNKHVYMAAKQEPTKDELSGVMRYGPSMPGNKLGAQLPYFFDEVFRLGIGKTQAGEQFRFIQTQPDLQFQAKDRSGSLAAVEPADLTHIFTKILGV